MFVVVLADRLEELIPVHGGFVPSGLGDLDQDPVVELLPELLFIEHTPTLRGGSTHRGPIFTVTPPAYKGTPPRRRRVGQLAEEEQWSSM